jgi:PAS domain S-box-containing protein
MFPAATSAVPAAHRPSKLVREVYRARTGAFAVCFVILGVLLHERGAGVSAWAWLVLTFLAYPHAAYLVARRSRHPRKAEHVNLLVDALLFGAWTAELGYPLWIGYALLSGTLLNNVVNRGLRGLLPALAVFSLGAAGWGALRGYALHTETSLLVSGLAQAGSLAYACLVAAIVYRQTQRAITARAELKRSEELYRLITENAADLIGLVDAEARWRYASPSWSTLLVAGDRQAGTDALARAAPGEGDAVRGALRSLCLAGNPAGMARFDLRLLDTTGRMRTLECTAHAVHEPQPGGADPGLAVLVCRDMTEHRASRDKLEIAALAFENMAEAVMITSADGRIAMVNKAYERITGLRAADVLGCAESDFRLAMQPPEFHVQIYAEVELRGRWAGSTWSRRKDGTVYREWRTVSAVRDEAGRIAYFVTVFFEMDAGPRMQAHPASAPGST